MKKRLVLILNGKGGVGKSFFAVNFIHYLKDRPFPHVAFDSDNENSTLKRFHPEAGSLNLASSRGLDPMIQSLDGSNLVVVDCRAASTDLFLDFFTSSPFFGSLINLVAQSNCFKTPERDLVRFIVHPQVKARAPEAVAWVKEFLTRFDISLLGWLRIDFGREHRDRQGRIFYKFQGVYGRCWYPTEKQPSIRLSCQVPGPFPCEIITRKKPIYRNSDGSWPAEAKLHRGPVYCDASSGRQWKRVYAKTTVKNLNEGVVWIFAHEAFHWLRKTGQIPGRNNEIEADAFADQILGKFRVIDSGAKDQLFHPTNLSQRFPVQFELFDGL